MKDAATLIKLGAFLTVTVLSTVMMVNTLDPPARPGTIRPSSPMCRD
jgi:hypothetical protein